MTIVNPKQIQKLFAGRVYLKNVAYGGTGLPFMSIKVALTAAVATAGENPITGAAVSVPLQEYSAPYTQGVTTDLTRNLVEMFDATTREKIVDMDGNEVFARVTYTPAGPPGGDWFVNFASLVNGVETVYIPPAAANFDFVVPYAFSIESVPFDFANSVKSYYVFDDPKAEGTKIAGFYNATTNTLYDIDQNVVAGGLPLPSSVPVNTSYVITDAGVDANAWALARAGQTEYRMIQGDVIYNDGTQFLYMQGSLLNSGNGDTIISNGGVAPTVRTTTHPLSGGDLWVDQTGDALKYWNAATSTWNWIKGGTNVTTGTLAARPATGTMEGHIYVVSSDTDVNNGRTYAWDSNTAAWIELGNDRFSATTAALRPAAATDGFIHYATDTGNITIYDFANTTWRSFNTPIASVGTLAARPISSIDGAIYVVTGDTAYNNGRAFVYDSATTVWYELGSDKFVADVAVNRPVSALDGFFFYATDTGSFSVYDAANTVWRTFGTITGPASSTDNAIVRWDGATGRIIQNSLVIIDDLANVSGVNDFDMTGAGYSSPYAGVAGVFDLSTSNFFTYTVAANTTFSFTNPKALKTQAFSILVSYTSGTITYPATVKWPAATAPTLTAGKKQLMTFVTYDGGANYYGFANVDY